MPRKQVLDDEDQAQTSSYSKPRASIFERIVPILLVAIIGLSFALGVLWQKVENLGGKPATVAADTAAVATPVPVSQDDIKNTFKQAVIKFGDENSKLVFIEIADPSCPFCHVAAGKNPELNKQMDPSGRFKLVADGGTYLAPVEEMKKLVDQGKASFAYIYTAGHGNGELGTKAMYCAFEKGKFWQVHDLLMTDKGYTLLNEQVLNDKTKSGQVADFLKVAMNPPDMKACLDSGKYDDTPSQETTMANSLGVSGTPGFFVNTTRFSGAYSFSDMQASVDSALK